MVLKFFASHPPSTLCVDPMPHILENFTEQYEIYLMYVYRLLFYCPTLFIGTLYMDE